MSEFEQFKSKERRFDTLLTTRSSVGSGYPLSCSVLYHSESNYLDAAQFAVKKEC